MADTADGGAFSSSSNVDAPLADRWDALRAAEATERAAHASAALAALSRPVTRASLRHTMPALPTDVWAFIMDRAPSCRCAPGREG